MIKYGLMLGLIVSSSKNPEKIRVDQDKARLEQRVIALNVEHDEIFEIVDNETVEKMAERSDEIEDELFTLKEQLKLLNQK